jgi:hypothetical protein
MFFLFSSLHHHHHQYMINMAYINSTEAPFGMGRRSVVNISPQVKTLIPGYTYLDFQIIAAISLGDKIYTAKDLAKPTKEKIKEIIEDAGFDFDKILKTCGKQQAIQDGGEDGDAVNNDEDGDDGDDGDEDNRSVATNATGRTAASASSSSSTTSTEASGKPLTGMEELALTHKMCKSFRTDGEAIV